MTGFSLVLVLVSASLTADVGAMKGGQIIKKPLPYTVYIATGDRDDVFYMRQHGQKYRMQEEANTEGSLPLEIQEYRVKEENAAASPSPASGGENKNLNNKEVDRDETSGAREIPINVEVGDIKGNTSGNVSPDATLDDAGVPNSGSASEHGKLVLVGEDGSVNNAKDETISQENQTEKSNEINFSKGHIQVEVEHGGESRGDGVDPGVNLGGLDDRKRLQGNIAGSSRGIASVHQNGPPRDEKVQDSKAKVWNVTSGNEIFSSGGDSTTISRETTTTTGASDASHDNSTAATGSTSISGDCSATSRISSANSESSTSTTGDSSATSGKSTTTRGEIAIPSEDTTTLSGGNEKPSNLWQLPKSQGSSNKFNDTGNPAPQCKVATSTSRPSTTSMKPPRPQTIWRMCMGVIFDELTILTGDICFVRAEGQHFFMSVNATNQNEAQEITKISNGRNHFDFRVIRLNANQTIPGLIPDWQDEDTVYWSMEEMSNNSRTGIVPSFGYPPMVAALKLLPLNTCKKIYDELLEEYPAQTSTLPAFLLDTVVCATQADEPILFPDDDLGLVKPGLACPDSLGAPFVLDDGTILGVLVAADCKVKNVAFFQTLGKGFPTVEEEYEEEIEQYN